MRRISCGIFMMLLCGKRMGKQTGHLDYCDSECGTHVFVRHFVPTYFECFGVILRQTIAWFVVRFAARRVRNGQPKTLPPEKKLNINEFNELVDLVTQ